MKKCLLIVVGCWLMVVGYANDTLTRAQVYNFNVGDTFDYRIHEVNPNIPRDTLSYYRTVITGKYVSANNDTIIYELNNNMMNTYTGLDSLEVFTYPWNGDTSGWSNYYAFDSLVETTISTNWMHNESYPLIEIHRFGKGLGEIYRESGSQDILGWISWSKELVYFSKGNITWGTPYNVLLGFEEIRNSQSAIRISPNPATSHLTIQLQQAPSSSTAFQLFDITGRMVLQKPLNDKSNSIDVSGVSKGMYLYSVVSDKEKVGAGKVIIE